MTLSRLRPKQPGSWADLTNSTQEKVCFEASMICDNFSIPSRVEVIKATPNDEPMLANLLELYVHDFSEILDLDIDEDGRFGYPSLPLYWSQSGHHPFLIRADGRLAGFAFVRNVAEASGSEELWDMAEFFVLRGYRRRGVGTLSAHEVWKRFPGLWEVRVMQRNTLALRFWAAAISGFTGKPVEPRHFDIDGEAWDLFSFQSGTGVATDGQMEDCSR